MGFYYCSNARKGRAPHISYHYLVCYQGYNRSEAFVAVSAQRQDDSNGPQVDENADASPRHSEN